MTGHMYIFHNTIFREDQWLPQGGLGGNRIVKHVVSRNNILHVRSAEDYSVSDNKQNIDNDFDYDLHNGQVPEGQEAHGLRGEPVYVEGAGFNPETRTGRFQLTADSPGAGAGVVIPNFSDGYLGAAPDMGAHQRGTAPMQFGVAAEEQAPSSDDAWVVPMKTVHRRFKGTRGTCAVWRLDHSLAGLLVWTETHSQKRFWANGQGFCARE